MSDELGGTDADVKKYFFSLPPSELRVILDLYEKEHGKSAREYAEATLRKWSGGAVHMSGTVASRLFKLLPPRMPLAVKYKLTENLWQHFGPSSRKVLRVGLDADFGAVMHAVEGHISQVLAQHKIPDNLERRFDWLSAGDVTVKQRLLGHLREMEKGLVIDGARAQLPVMLDHIRSVDGANTHRMAQILKVGKHELEVTIERSFSGVDLRDPLPERTISGHVARRQPSGRRDYQWLWWLLAIALFALFLLLKKG